jgi:hypothetical protein
MQLSDLVSQHRSAASTYHDHKEKTAYAVTPLYLTGMSVWLLSDNGGRSQGRAVRRW